MYMLRAQAREPRGRFRGGCKRQRGTPRGHADRRIHTADPLRDIAEEFVYPAAQTEGWPEALWRRFTPAHRAPDEGGRQQRHKAGEPVHTKRDVVDQVEANPAMQAAGFAVSEELPEVIVDLETTGAILPEPQRFRKIEIDELRAGRRIAAQSFFDALPVVRPR